ncbi:hypothetical protein Tco_0084526 [Tanacetum coccineum]
MGSHRLRFNLARFQRGDKPLTKSQKEQIPNKMQIPNKIHIGMNNKSYESVLNNKVEGENAMGGTPMMVIDEEWFIDKNLDLTLVAKVKIFESLLNLRVICNQEGFEDMTIRYLGGFQVALEFKHAHAREQFQNHVGESSWFTSIIPWWGELLFIEDPNDNNLWQKILCVKTKWEGFIMESFIILIKGKISVIQAREIIGWNPEFIDEDNENDSHSEVESEFTLASKELDLEDKTENGLYADLEQEFKEKEGGKLDDPFGLYDLLKKGNQYQENSKEESDNLSKPPGFKFRVTDEVMK